MLILKHKMKICKHDMWLYNKLQMLSCCDGMFWKIFTTTYLIFYFFLFPDGVWNILYNSILLFDHLHYHLQEPQIDVHICTISMNVKNNVTVANYISKPSFYMSLFVRVWRLQVMYGQLLKLLCRLPSPPYITQY